IKKQYMKGVKKNGILKDINLKELAKEMESKNEEIFLAEKMYSPTLEKRQINKNYIMAPPNKSKFSSHLNFVTKIENDTGIFIDKEIDYEKKHYEKEFVPPLQEPKKVLIPCAFKKFFSKTVKEDILKMAVENPKRLSELVENSRKEITNEALYFLNNILVANYPFATITPNVGVMLLADSRLEKLSKYWQSKKTTPSVIEIVDIA
ncbi:19202_t:CDS:2, partial [Racocetra persica]